MFQEIGKRPKRAIFQQKVQIIFVLERSMELHHIVVICQLAADVSLTEHGLHLVILGYMRLLQLFKRELFSVAAGKVHLTVGSSA